MGLGGGAVVVLYLGLVRCRSALNLERYEMIKSRDCGTCASKSSISSVRECNRNFEDCFHVDACVLAQKVQLRLCIT